MDASKGALATLLQDLFPSWPGEAHLFCLEGEINQQCGVAELEGHGWLSPAQIQGGAYQGFAFLAGMLALTRHPLVTSGEKALAGLVFDGDGDRLGVVTKDGKTLTTSKDAMVSAPTAAGDVLVITGPGTRLPAAGVPW